MHILGLFSCLLLLKETTTKTRLCWDFLWFLCCCFKQSIYYIWYKLQCLVVIRHMCIFFMFLKCTHMCQIFPTHQNVSLSHIPVEFRLPCCCPSFFLCTFTFSAQWCSAGRRRRLQRPRQKKRMGVEMKKAAKGENQASQSFICLLTSSLVYQWCVSEEQSRPSAAESSVVSHFCSAAGDQRVGETEGNNRLRRKEEEERKGGGERGRGRVGLGEFAGSLVYSVVVLTSEWTPADTRGSGVSPM